MTPADAKRILTLLQDAGIELTAFQAARPDLTAYVYAECFRRAGCSFQEIEEAAWTLIAEPPPKWLARRPFPDPGKLIARAPSFIARNPSFYRGAASWT